MRTKVILSLLIPESILTLSLRIFLLTLSAINNTFNLGGYTMERKSGILLHVSSLPSNYGIGSLGKSAYDFADFLAASKQTYWQILPLGPTSKEGSPYNSNSAFAGNPFLIDLDYLIKNNLINYSDIPISMKKSPSKKVNYKTLNKYRYQVLKKSYNNLKNKMKEFEEFKRSNSFWLDDYSLYIALKNYFDKLPWYKWPDEGIKLHQRSSIKKYRSFLEENIDEISFIQFLFYEQLQNLKTYLNIIGIKLIGDMPLYVSHDSCDVWSNRELFKLDGNNLPTEVAGVPPDYYSKNGQVWNTPIYEWDNLKKSNYEWWIKRMSHQLKYVDLLRIDHFRGIESYWSIPYGDITAKNGHWNKGPGKDLIDVINTNFNKGILLAENLGLLTNASEDLLKYSGYLGMNVIQFEKNLERIDNKTVLYTSTHDNDTLLGYIKKQNLRESCHDFLLKGSNSNATMFLASMQDYLELPSKCRMNTPNTVKHNWQWRLKTNEISETLSSKISEITIQGRRT